MSQIFDAVDYVPKTLSLRELKRASLECRACPLWERGTQTVFGEGRRRAPLMLVGEQPGNEEDLTGRPFVGPAGKLLSRALDEAGIERSNTYLTNVVKHFKWEPRGKRRLHKKPNAREIAACRPWLETELLAVKPALVICLGATAAQALIGKTFKVTVDRGKFFESDFAGSIMATVHPSSILRAPDEESRELEYKLFVGDLKKAARALANKA